MIRLNRQYGNTGDYWFLTKKNNLSPQQVIHQKFGVADSDGCKITRVNNIYSVSVMQDGEPSSDQTYKNVIHQCGWGGQLIDI